MKIKIRISYIKYTFYKIRFEISFDECNNFSSRSLITIFFFCKKIIHIYRFIILCELFNFSLSLKSILKIDVYEQVNIADEACDRH